MPEKIRKILFASLFLFISAVFAWEGRSVMLLHDRMHTHHETGHGTDLEIPHQQKHLASEEDEKIVMVSSPDLSGPADICPGIRSVKDLMPIDYSGLIWQPPRSR